jgi:RNA polymerase sigma-70 factor (ECF subfamily)
MKSEHDQPQPESDPALPAPVPGVGSVLNPERWLDDHGDVLFGFAMVRVRDSGTAQELVQETFLAALQSQLKFAGNSSERAWLFGILRNKVVDHYRRHSREIPLTDLESALPDEDDFFQTSGMGKDGWAKGQAPKSWPSPDENLISKEFLEVFDECTSRLPDKTAQVFLLREVDGVTSEDICKDLNISANNLWVMLHRACIATVP